MERIVCFADGGGPFQPCRKVCVALLCYERGPNIDRTPFEVYERLVSLLGWRRGELKWRSVKKAARRRGVGESRVARLVVEESLCYSLAAGHLVDPCEAGLLKERLLLEAAERLASLGLRAATLIVDVNLARPEALRRAARMLGASYARMGNSRVYIGVQLADIAAGACAENAVEASAACRTPATSSYPSRRA